MQLGTKHISSHVGDEYAERTGRRRIGYTREELVAGAVWSIDARWRTYGEAGWGFATKDEIGQEPGRLQLGLEHEAPGASGKAASAGTPRWICEPWKSGTGKWTRRSRSASSSPQETAAGGSASASTRGAVPIGEFYRVDETYVALGLWLAP